VEGTSILRSVGGVVDVHIEMETGNDVESMERARASRRESIDGPKSKDVDRNPSACEDEDKLAVSAMESSERCR
jgi:hypothetical protein